ncbi:FadR/GntR family transcriptional regulator [Celeribacter sp. PS-C1]|uniref:FadR/GntR family transcriptional regulator n=1 Tax=Celeribacter sp. PS-C1 TaxID=2820813 RepID=UPI001CA5D5BF|nr:FCD domain-containing protein [Celeribacter sp. PS-C1]MBW6417636.1 FCD domain-containing protein [Celeribacter sp. PS-C1]
MNDKATSDQSVKRTDREEDLVEHLRGLLKASEDLPPERILAETLKVSRHSLRKALKVLRDNGELTPAKSGRRAHSETSSPAPSSAKLVQSTNPLEVMEMRLMIEPALARLAALRASPDEIAHILQTAHSPADLSPAQADQDFHRAVAAGSRNSLASELHILLHRVQNDARLRFTDADSDEHTTVERVKARDLEHQRIAAAIASRDPLTAERAMFDHLERTQRKLMGLGMRPGDAA